MTSPRTARVAGVILAAGRGTRMGAFAKQLLDLNGKPIVQHVIDSAIQSQLAEIWIVLGHQFAQVRELIDEGPHGQIVFNPHFEKGQGTSVRAGVNSVSPSIEAAMMLLGDQPGVTSAMIDQLIEAYARLRPLLVVPRYSGKPGNPVIIDRRLFPEIRGLRGDIGAKSLFEKHSCDIEYFDFDLPRPPDIDTMDDYLAVTDAENRQAI